MDNILEEQEDQRVIIKVCKDGVNTLVRWQAQLSS